MLSLRNVVLTRGGRTILKDLCASADRGDVVALRGPNGAGKTTLLHFIAGILKGDSGGLHFFGSRIDGNSLDWRRRLVYVLDDGGTIPLLTVEEQLYLQGALNGVGHKESLERARLVIDLLELDGYRGYRADELSSGVRKRLGIGLGVVRDADVFLFDEPYSALDIQATMIFGRILMTLRNRGRIVVVASHSFPFSGNLYNRVWTLSAGTLADGHARDLPEGLDHSIRLESLGEYGEIDIPWMPQAT